jgi:nucleotide-binding universal stress UspA family protein
MGVYQNILVATDFSEAADHAVKTADALAGILGANLTILHVIEHFPEDMPVSVIPPEDVDPQQFLIDRARRYLEQLSAGVSQPVAALEVEVSTQSAGREIVRYAQGHDNDLIVVGSRGEQGIKGSPGSAANSVVQAATVDVLVTRPSE